MTNLSKPKKQTAANNTLLAYTKKQYNHKIYSTVLSLVNTVGTSAAIDHLVTFTRQDLRAGERIMLWDIATGTPAKPSEVVS